MTESKCLKLCSMTAAGPFRTGKSGLQTDKAEKECRGSERKAVNMVQKGIKNGINRNV